MPSQTAFLRLIAQLRALALVHLATFLCLGQNGSVADEPKRVLWHDPASHSVQMIRVDKDVELEVLDWGGTGRAVVLLTGLGNTAHVFDEFAPKLTSGYHVYGITRRGYGASSSPATGYGADRLGDDVLAVFDALKIPKPILVGHSIAGEELSSIATRHPERIAGAVYLDAAYSFAYYDPSVGDLNIDLIDLQKKLYQLSMQPPEPRPLVQELLQTDLPLFERDLRQFQKQFEAMVNSRSPRRDPTTADRASFDAYRSWQARTQGPPFPEAELRQQFEVNRDGSLGRWRMKSFVAEGIAAGQQKYTKLQVPILAIYAVDNGHPNEEQIAAFEKGVPSAHVVRLPRANHYVYLSNEGDVLRATQDFITSLP
jgi:non-heme chloroperoxidase